MTFEHSHVLCEYPQTVDYQTGDCNGTQRSKQKPTAAPTDSALAAWRLHTAKQRIDVFCGISHLKFTVCHAGSAL